MIILPMIIVRLSCRRLRVRHFSLLAYPLRVGGGRERVRKYQVYQQRKQGGKDFDFVASKPVRSKPTYMNDHQGKDGFDPSSKMGSTHLLMYL